MMINNSLQPKHILSEMKIADEWTGKAMKALQVGDPALAIQALQQSRKHYSLAKDHFVALFPDGVPPEKL